MSVHRFTWLLVQTCSCIRTTMVADSMTLLCADLLKQQIKPAYSHSVLWSLVAVYPGCWNTPEVYAACPKVLVCIRSFCVISKYLYYTLKKKLVLQVTLHSCAFIWLTLFCFFTLKTFSLKDFTWIILTSESANCFDKSAMKLISSFLTAWLN